MKYRFAAILCGSFLLASADPFLGEIRGFTMNFCPKGWTMTNGQLLPINQNQGLFSLLGTMYGGDGRVNFALPDLRGRSILHNGNGYTQGQYGGAETHTLTIAEMPTHTHLVSLADTSKLTVRVGISDSAANSVSSNGAALSKSSGMLAADTSVGAVQNIGVTLDPILLDGRSTGGSQPFSVRSPYLVITYCIALQGIFPSQN